MLTIYYSPHMTSVDNEAGRASGHADVPLSDRGRELAVELGGHYAGIHLDAIFSSDLQRASVTTEIAFGKRGVPIALDSRLRETDFGEMTQWPSASLEEEKRIVVPFPGGESLLMAVNRVGSFLRDVQADYEGKTILVIGHRVTRFALKFWTGDEPLERVIAEPWPWLDVPIWRYELQPGALDRRVNDLPTSELQAT